VLQHLLPFVKVDLDGWLNSRSAIGLSNGLPSVLEVIQLGISISIERQGALRSVHPRLEFPAGRHRLCICLQEKQTTRIDLARKDGCAQPQVQK
jgi:hypothetical protein